MIRIISTVQADMYINQSIEKFLRWPKYYTRTM